MILDKELDRMRWAARRGMLELDLVLGPFVEQRYSSLSEVDKKHFQNLLLSEDQDLFSWFLRRQQPEDEELLDIVQQILDHTLSPTDG